MRIKESINTKVCVILEDKKMDIEGEKLDADGGHLKAGSRTTAENDKVHFMGRFMFIATNPGNIP